MTQKVPEGHQYFQGEYHEGDARYFYIPSGNEQIFDGEFDFNMSMGGGMYRKAHGHFANNKKTGEWEFARRGTDSLKKLSAKFNEGLVEGELEYTFEQKTIDDSVMNWLRVSAKAGKICGKIEGFLEGGEFLGQYDENGFADGIWTLTFKSHDSVTGIKKEVWEHGVLVSSIVEGRVWKTEKPMKHFFRKKLNNILNSDIQKLLLIVGRGTLNPPLHIREA